MQLLRDNLTLWTSSDGNEAEGAPAKEDKTEEEPTPAPEEKAEEAKPAPAES
jgi:14-3-3 protein epsilon